MAEPEVETETLAAILSSLKQTAFQAANQFRVLDVEPGDSNLVLLFNPFVAMGKDFVDTFKPYKNHQEKERDMQQFPMGLLNILKGMAGISFAGLGFAFALITSPVSLWARPAMFVGMVALFTGSFLFSIEMVIRGVTQIATAPLVFLFKIPLRSILAHFQNKASTEVVEPLMQKSSVQERQEVSEDDATLSTASNRRFFARAESVTAGARAEPVTAGAIVDSASATRPAFQPS